MEPAGYPFSPTPLQLQCQAAVYQSGSCAAAIAAGRGGDRWHRDYTAGRSRQLARGGDDHGLAGAVAAGRGRGLHLPHHVHPLQHCAKHHVAAVQPGGGHGRDEELRSAAGGGARRGGHAQVAGRQARRAAPAARMRTWLPFVLGPALAMDSRPGRSCLTAGKGWMRECRSVSMPQRAGCTAEARRHCPCPAAERPLAACTRKRLVGESAAVDAAAARAVSIGEVATLPQRGAACSAGWSAAGATATAHAHTQPHS